MKRVLLCAQLALLAQVGFSQGTVLFNNRLAGATTHVWFGCPYQSGNSPIDAPAGTTSYEGFVLVGAPGGPNAATTFASLLGAPGSNAPAFLLQPGALNTPSGHATTFRTGGAAGNVAGAIATFANIPPDAPAGTFQMVVWDNSSGLYPTWQDASAAGTAGVIAIGRSELFVITNIGGFSNPPPSLRTLTSFSWGYLECPPTIAQQPTNQAAVVGGQAAFSVRGRTWQGPNTYQWYFKSSPIAGATSSVLALSNLQLSDFGPYKVIVGDNNPPLTFVTSVIAQLTVALDPSLTNSQNGSTSRIWFRTEIGPVYVVEFKSTLSDPAWVPLATNAGTGGLVTVTNTNPGSLSRFFRVQVY